jgi:hypothetical protein
MRIDNKPASRTVVQGDAGETTSELHLNSRLGRLQDDPLKSRGALHKSVDG